MLPMNSFHLSPITNNQSPITNHQFGFGSSELGIGGAISIYQDVEAGKF